MNKIRTITLSLIMSMILSCCKKQINDGKIITMYSFLPHEEKYNYSTLYYIGKQPVFQWHEATRWIPDTTFHVRFMKVINKDTIYREIQVSKTDFYNYYVGDLIKLKDE